MICDFKKHQNNRKHVDMQLSACYSLICVIIMRLDIYADG